MLLGRHAPYALTSLPVLLGTVGGIGLLVGSGRAAVAEPAPRSDCTAIRPRSRWTAASSRCCSWSALTGLALLAWRDTGAMAVLLAVHLGAVMALFVTLPYGKFAHGVYRSAALLKWAIEKRQPNPLMLTED